MTKIYPWVHINQVPAELIRSLFPTETVIVDGDCGSEWGERHSLEGTCPNPHILMMNVSEETLMKMRVLGIPYAADVYEDWGEEVQEWRWREMEGCATSGTVSFVRSPIEKFGGHVTMPWGE